MLVAQFVEVALARVPWPEFITVPAYYSGHAILALLGHKVVDDY